MKTVIFSDTHLTNKFEEKRFEKLSQIVHEADQVIINGDFWDGMSISFDSFINSPWKQLFPLLKQKHMIYIYGNHDRKRYCDKRVDLFSDEQYEHYEFTSGNNSFYVTHGHQIVPFGDTDEMGQFEGKKKNNLYEFAEGTIILFTGQLLMRFYRIFNKKMKKYVHDHLKNGEILVTGHIHAPEFDLKNRYINTFFRHHLVSYVVIDGDKIDFKQEKL